MVRNRVYMLKINEINWPSTMVTTKYGNNEANSLITKSLSNVL